MESNLQSIEFREENDRRGVCETSQGRFLHRENRHGEDVVASYGGSFQSLFGGGGISQSLSWKNR